MSKSNSFLINIYEIFFIIIIPIILKDLGIILVFVYFVILTLVKRKDEWLLKSLIYFFIFRYFNPIFIPLSSVSTIFSWLMVIIVFVRVVLISNISDYKLLTPFFLFVIISLISSIFKSDYLAISLFKLFSFVIGFLAVYLSIKRTINYRWEDFIISIWIFFLLSSLPTLFYPQIGFARNSTGFQGLTNHPQFLGPFCALLGGISIVLFSMQKLGNIKSKAFFFLFPFNLLVIILSESRTALLLFSILILTGFFIYFKDNRYIFVKYFPNLILLTLFSILIVLLNFSYLETKIINFLAKDRTGSTSDLTFERFSRSRSGLVDIALQNFNENPLLGIGFSAPNHYYDFSIEYLPNTNIPISASMEKGNLFTLLLEEVGLLGFLFFIGFVLSVLIPALRNNKIYIVFVLGPLILNMGEATFFSTNGQGILLWSLFSLALIKSRYYSNFNNNESLYMAVSP